MINTKLLERIIDAQIDIPMHEEDDSCDWCIVNKELRENKRMHIIFENLLKSMMLEGPEQAIPDAVCIGFCLAYEYFQVKELEDINAR